MSNYAFTSHLHNDVHDSEIHNSVGKSVFIWSVVTMALIFGACITCVCYFICTSEEIGYFNNNHGEEGGDIHHGDDHNYWVGRRGSSDDEEGRREHRRSLVLSNIFHEKVIRLEDTDGISLPHEKEILIRKTKNGSTSSICAHSEINHSIRRKSNTTRKKRKKKQGGSGRSEIRENDSCRENSISSTSSENMNNESMRSIRQSMIGIKIKGNGNINSTSVPLFYSMTSCPICTESYHAGEEIAWSKNEQCQHAYHVECIMGWLIDHDNCPLCRAKYLNIENENV